MKIDGIRENDVLTFWFDTGCKDPGSTIGGGMGGAQIMYALVTKVNRKTVDVRFENGDVRRRAQPHHFQRKLGPTEWRPAAVGGAKPCPFCGESEPEIKEGQGNLRYRVQCLCGARTADYAFPALALDAWNRRSS